jgi:DNA-directed RNA polymerase specialized sigma24 family protein
MLSLPLREVTPHERRALNDGLARLADGDRGAFDAVYRLAYPALRAFAARHLPAADAEDTAQQALVALFARADEYDPARDALGWALGIAAWEIRTHRRRVGRRREDVPAGEPACDGPSPEHALLDAELRASLAEAVAALRPADAEAVLASAGLAPRPPLPAATFRKRVERAFCRLRDLWRKEHGVD